MTQNSPIFIVGASRSGTTMLRLLLNAHSRIGVPKEFSYFASIPEHWLQSWHHVPVPANEYRQFIREHLFREHVLREAGTDADIVLERILSSADSRDLSIPYRLMLEAYADTEGKPRWGEKTPINLFYCDVLYQMFPDAKFIHLVRDPRAVVRSANNFPRLPDDTLINATNWQHFMEKGHKRLVESVPSAQQYTLRYEDLTSDPEPVAQKICQFINEPFDACMLDFHKESSSYMPSSLGELGGNRKVTQPIYSDKQAKWRIDLSEHEIGIVELICREYMRDFGYEPTGAQLQWSALANLWLKYIYSALKRWQHRKDRYHIIRYSTFRRLRQLRLRPSS